MSDEPGDRGTSDSVVPFPTRSPTPVGTPTALPRSRDYAAEIAEINLRSAPTDLVQQDQRCLDDEQAFKQRFRFNADRAGRFAILDLQTVTGLTSAQVTLLWWTGCLVLDGRSARVSANAWMFITGAFFLSITALLMLMAFLKALSVPPRPIHAPILGAVELAFLGMGYVAYLAFIRPVQIRRRLAALDLRQFL